MIPAFLIKKFGPLGAKLIFFGGIILIIGVALLITYFQGRSDGKMGAENARLKREVEVQKNIGNANTNAAGTRAEDAARAAQQEKELNDALHVTQDPDRQRALRGCIILQQQGRDTSRIPACRRP